MHSSHIGHDSVVGDDCTISPLAVLGGHTRMHSHSSLGIGACTHQRSTVGAWAFAGMHATITKDVPPYALVMGNPARLVRVNARGVEAAGWNAGDVYITPEGVVKTMRAGAAAHFEAFAADSRGRAVVKL
jgi:acyl-[acyl carrier protein]--UDP-N-acetylglucosamine O-acyltransferase